MVPRLPCGRGLHLQQLWVLSALSLRGHRLHDGHLVPSSTPSFSPEQYNSLLNLSKWSSEGLSFHGSLPPSLEYSKWHLPCPTSQEAKFDCHPTSFAYKAPGILLLIPSVATRATPFIIVSHGPDLSPSFHPGLPKDLRTSREFCRANQSPGSPVIPVSHHVKPRVLPTIPYVLVASLTLTSVPPLSFKLHSPSFPSLQIPSYLRNLASALPSAPDSSLFTVENHSVRCYQLELSWITSV